MLLSHIARELSKLNSFTIPSKERRLPPSGGGGGSLGKDVDDRASTSTSDGHRDGDVEGSDSA
ncbi:hypothetical protein CSUI_002840, partial [Cystoisospora suis]